MNTTADLTIVRSVLDAISKEIDHPMGVCVEELKNLEKRLSSGDATASKEFWNIVKTRGLANTVIADNTDAAIRFIESQIKNLEQIRTQRPLTDEEKDIARGTLGGVIKSLKQLATEGQEDRN